MNRAARNARAAICLTLLLSACDATLAPYRATEHDRVGEELRDFERALRSRNLQRVESFFSSETHGGPIEIRNRIEDSWRRERLVQLQFIVNRVGERDGLFNVQAKWNKSYLDNAGKPQKKSGVSEFILKPEGESFRILNISGDPLF